MSSPTGVHGAEALPEPDLLFEVINGQRVELPPMGAYEAGLAGVIDQLLGAYVRANDLGRVAPEMLFALPVIDRECRPDVAFVSYDRWPRNRRIPRSNAWPVVPDLAIEVVSPNNLAEHVLAKTIEYFRAGVRGVWVVWPEAEQIYRYTSPAAIQVFTRSDTIDGGDILPGFSLPLSQLFEEGDNPATDDQSPLPPMSSEQ